MNCSQCDQKAVLTLQHGKACKRHFINYFEEKVFKTMNKYQMIGRSDTLGVAASGGKDSLTVLYLTKKYMEKNIFVNTSFFALAIDEVFTKLFFSRSFLVRYRTVKES